MHLTVHVDGVERSVPLAATTLVGRHWSCGVVVPAMRAPSFWLELRWHEDGWRWRELAGSGVTQGSGGLLPGGWRPFGARPVRFDGDLWIALADVSAPEAGLVDLATGDWRAASALPDGISCADGAWWTSPAEESAAERLHDGDVLVVGGRALRFLAGVAFPKTQAAGFHVAHRDVRLDIDVDAQTASFTCGTALAEVRGACVRALAAYVDARRKGRGWMTRDEAFVAWQALGGNPGSDAERLGWERGKVKAQLAAQGVLGVRDLFETRVVEGVWETRITVG